MTATETKGNTPFVKHIRLSSQSSLASSSSSSSHGRIPTLHRRSIQNELRVAMLAGRCTPGQLAQLVVKHLADNHPIRAWMQETFQEKSLLFLLPTVLVASIFGFLSLGDHARLSRTTRCAKPIASLTCASPHTIRVATTRCSDAMMYLCRNQDMRPKRLELDLKFRHTDEAKAKNRGDDDDDDYDEGGDGDAEVYVDVRLLKMIPHVCEIVDGDVSCQEEMASCWDPLSLILLSETGLPKLHTFRTRIDVTPSFATTFRWSQFPELRDLQVRTVTATFFTGLRNHGANERLTHFRFSNVDDSYGDDYNSARESLWSDLATFPALVVLEVGGCICTTSDLALLGSQAPDLRRLTGVDFGTALVAPRDFRDLVPQHVRTAMVTCTASHSTAHLLSEMPSVYDASVGGVAWNSLVQSSTSTSTSLVPLNMNLTHLKVTVRNGMDASATFSQMATLSPLVTLKTLDLEVHHNQKCTIQVLPLHVTFPHLEEFRYSGPVGYSEWEGICQCLQEVTSLRRLTLGGGNAGDATCTIPLVTVTTGFTRCGRLSCQHLLCLYPTHDIPDQMLLSPLVSALLKLVVQLPPALVLTLRPPLIVYYFTENTEPSLWITKLQTCMATSGGSCIFSR